jgi:hypothetical protein
MKEIDQLYTAISAVVSALEKLDPKSLLELPSVEYCKNYNDLRDEVMRALGPNTKFLPPAITFGETAIGRVVPSTKYVELLSHARRLAAVTTPSNE